MTLNASGPISLGGSTVGQSVDLEVGRTANAQISFNDFAVRQMTGTATNSTISLPTSFWGKSSTPGVSTYFQAVYVSPSVGWSAPIWYGQFRDANENTFLVGTQANVRSDTWIAKLDKNGNVLWQKSYYDAAQGSPTMSDSDGCSCIDSSGNVYWISKSGIQKFFINKIDNNGNMIYCKAVTMPASPSGSLDPSALRVNAAGTVLWATIGVQYFDTYAYTAAIVYFNATDGSFVNQKIFSRWPVNGVPNSAGFNAAGTFIDSSNNLWMTASAWNGSFYSTYIGAVSTSMSIVFQRVYTLPGSGGYPIINAGLMPLYSPAANTIAFIGQSYNATGSTGYARIALHVNTSTGAVSNAISFTGSNQLAYTGGSAFGAPVNVDSSGNVYVLFVGNSPASVGDPWYGSVVKFNLASLSIQWQQSYTRGPWYGTNSIPNTQFGTSNPNGGAYTLGGGGGYVVYNPSTNRQDVITNGSMVFQAASDGSMTGTFTYSTNPAAPSPVSTTFATSSIIGTTPLTVNNASTTQLSLTTGIFSIYPNIPIVPTDTTWVVERRLQP